MSRKNELAKNTAILTFGKICTQFISFFLLPLYTHLLSPSDYGLFDLMVTYTTLLLPLVNWQYDQGIFRYLLDCRNDKPRQDSLFSSIFVSNTLHVIIFDICMIFVTFFIDLKHVIFLMLYVTLHVYTALLLQFARGIGKTKVYAFASFVSASSTIVFNVITLVAFHMKLGGLYISTILAQAVAIMYLIITLKPHRYFHKNLVSKSVTKEIRKYSLPLIPNNLAWWIVNVSDRTIVSHILGVTINGIYTVANKFSNVFISFYNIFVLSWTETVSLHYDDLDRDEFLSDVISSLYNLFSCACFGVVALMPFVFPILVDSKYAKSYDQIIILMYAMLFRVVVGLYSSIYVAQKDTKKIAYTSAASAIINITVHLLLINKIGLYAASLSTVVAFGIMMIIRYIDINRTIHMKISLFSIVSSLMIGMALLVTYYRNDFITNIIMLVVVIIYALYQNYTFLLSSVDTFKKYMNKLKN